MLESSCLVPDAAFGDIVSDQRTPSRASGLARCALASANQLLHSPIPAVAPEAEADRECLRRVKQGDEAAASQLIQRLFPTVVRSVRAHLPRRSQEEDLAQMVFAKIFQKLDQFSGLVPLEHWVSRIAVNTCLTELRRENCRPELRMSDLSEEEQLTVQHLSTSHAALDPGNESRELLQKLLSVLKPEERLVITLLHLQEKSTREISEFTGWSVSRIKVKAFRARAKLRRAWKRLATAKPLAAA